MNFALVSILLALIWAVITANSSLLNILLGWVIGLVALWFVRKHIANPVLFERTRRVIALALLFFYELALSAIRVAFLVVTPNLNARLKPGIVAFPLKAKSDSEITLLANLITLTPGTLSVDVSEDRRFIYVHVLSMTNKNEVINSIAQGFESKIIEVFR